MREKDDFVKMKCFREINNKRGAGAGTVCENKFLRDMVDRLAVGQEEVRLSSLHSLILTASLTVGHQKWTEQSEGREKTRDKTGGHWVCHPGLV